ncbi:MAG TPA: alkaline phosphatase [Elusimicrobiota bacterium]|nr:alkaline phosphatase [Elusimicrobiota bacterium]
MRMIPRFLIGFLFLMSLSDASAADRSRRLILLIGDGMGPAVVGLGQVYSELVLKKPELSIQKAMRRGRCGYIATRSANSLVTDSAASATAYACGVKTNNGSLGVDPDGKSHPSILEMAQKKGMSSGLVTTCRLADATPAAFSSHVMSRADKFEIGLQQIEKKVTVLLGGGAKDYDLSHARQSGYWVLTSRSMLLSSEKDGKPLWIGVFADKEIPFRDERTAEIPTLTEMTEAAVGKLDQDPDGFFLLVEGGRIDHAAHSNAASRLKDEFLEFDETVGWALSFQEKNPDTILFITADHDTGGVALTEAEYNQGGIPTLDDLKNMSNISFVSRAHTGSPVFLIGVGPGTEKANGWHDNTELFGLMKEALGL